MSDSPFENLTRESIPARYHQGRKMFGGRFTLMRRLGHGGMALVWLAQDNELALLRALKFAPPEVAGDAKSIAMLKREAIVGTSLAHASIVRILDFVQDAAAGECAVVMEAVEGKTLSDLQAERIEQTGVGFFEPEEISPWLEQAAAALDYAHGQGLVHRDLKPQNLMIENSTQLLKVMDFGICLAIGDTVPGTWSGTPGYMSPQQLDNEPATAGDDIYSLGATLYNLLTGFLPFDSGAAVQTIRDGIAQSMQSRRVKNNRTTGKPLPESWEHTVNKCLEKEPALRPPTARSILKLAQKQENKAVISAPQKNKNIVEKEYPRKEVKRRHEKNNLALNSGQFKELTNNTVQEAPSSLARRIVTLFPLFIRKHLRCRAALLRFTRLFSFRIAQQRLSAFVQISAVATSGGETTKLAPIPLANLTEPRGILQMGQIYRLLVFVLLPCGILVWWLSSPTSDTGNQSSNPLDSIQTSGALLSSNATKESPFINSLGMHFVPVPRTHVYFCKWETRARDYAVFLGGEKLKETHVSFTQTDLDPVSMVSYADAEAFCHWLSVKEGLRYRLPTDHEWSCAVGIGDLENASESPASKSAKLNDIYPWDGPFPPTVLAGNINTDATNMDDIYAANMNTFTSVYDFLRPTPKQTVTEPFIHTLLAKHTEKVIPFRSTFPTGMFGENSLGLADLCGNVGEWCCTWWNHPSGYRVIRGSDFTDYTSTPMLSSFRRGYDPSSRFSCYGFRVVVEHDL